MGGVGKAKPASNAVKSANISSPLAQPGAVVNDLQKEVPMPRQPNQQAGQAPAPIIEPPKPVVQQPPMPAARQPMPPAAQPAPAAPQGQPASQDALKALIQKLLLNKAPQGDQGQQ